MDTLIAINPDPELAALVSAYETLDQKRSELCSGPLAFFKIVQHARDHVDSLISERYSESKSLHTHDGAGRLIEGGPVTTAEACEQGIAQTSSRFFAGPLGDVLFKGFRHHRGKSPPLPFCNFRENIPHLCIYAGTYYDLSVLGFGCLFHLHIENISTIGCMSRENL